MLWQTGILAALCLVVVNSGSVGRQPHVDSLNLGLHLEWKEWKATYNKNYDNKIEESNRFSIWKSNRARIIKHNNDMKGESFTLSINQFADLTANEFKYHIHGHNGSCYQEFEDLAQKEQIPVVNPAFGANLNDLPESIDWSEDPNIVTPVKNQGSCGSCWAFSAVGATESRYAIANNVLNSLSEQELVDCSTLNSGCSGGNMVLAFSYIKRNNGLALESEYVYTAQDGTCESSQYTHYDAISGYVSVTADDENALMTAVSEGPVSVAVQADQFAFQFYSGGIIDGRCGTSLDHGVVLVGYGEDEDSGEQYWKIKNSWGDSWGEDGYARICRNCAKNDGDGECGILMAPSYPTVS